MRCAKVSHAMYQSCFISDMLNTNNILTTGWGHIMMELAIPLSLELKPQNIITIGWDIKSVNKYWDVEHFTNWSNADTVINNFTSYLHKYLLDSKICNRWVLDDWYESGSYLVWNNNKLSPKTL